MNQKRSIKSKLIRKEKSTLFKNKYGMTSEQIHKAINKNKSSNNPIKQKSKIDFGNTRPVKKAQPPKSSTQTIKSIRSSHVRPKKQNRLLNKKVNLLLEVPEINMSADQIDTPDWFTFKEKADVSVIVPLFKSSHVIKDLIDSWDIKENMKVEVIFVDDSCPQNSKSHVVPLWEQHKNELRNPVGKIFHNKTNQGFGVSSNIGASHATGDYLIFLNADTVVTSGWIRPIIRLLKKEDVGIVGNLQIRHGVGDEIVDSAGSEWSWESKSFQHIGRDIYHGRSVRNSFTLKNCPKDLFEVQEREMVTGACLSIRKELFDDIGGFNPNYRIGYWEDSEICMAVKEKGYKVMYQPNSKIYHKVSHSKSNSHKYASHNTNYFENKWIKSGRIDRFVKNTRDPIKEVKSILVKRHSAHGDVLIASGVASALKKKHPGSKIFFMTELAEVLKNNPHIDGVISQNDLRHRSFDLYYNLDAAYEFRPNTNILEAYADIVGVDVKDCELFIDKKEVENLPSKYVVIHAGGTNWVGRNWSSSKFDIVSSRLRSQGYKVVLVGSNRDHKISDVDLDLMNKLDMHELSYVINNADLFIGIDSFPMHIAQSVETSGICFFGSIKPETRLVNDCIDTLFANNVSCLGCHHRQFVPCVVTGVCQSVVQECINNVSVDMMMEKIKNKLGEI